MTSESTNWKGSISEAETSDDGEPRLQIVDPFETEHPASTNRHQINRPSFQKSMSLNEDVSNASEAVESLLMLGRGDIWSSKTSLNSEPMSDSEVVKNRRFSSGDGSGFSQDEKGVVTYYQKMRERNNEASKRCRLKRRLKAESLEGQLNYLSSANKMLKQRIVRMENISKVIKDGISKIQPKDCNCLQTVALIQQVNRDYKETMDLTNAALLKTSKSYRDQNPELLLPSSSDDDFSVDMSAANSPVTPVFQSQTNPAPTFSGFLVKMNPSLSCSPLTKLPTPVNPLFNTQTRPKTALDVLNDTIIKSLGSSTSTSSTSSPSSTPIKSLTPNHNNFPLNLVKILPSPSSSTHQEQKPMILITPTSSSSPKPVTQSLEIIKTEPDTNEAAVNGVEPIEACVAAAIGGSCRGPLLNLNKLTSYLNTTTGQPVATDDGTSAMERAIIKSRMRIPFWKADEFPSFICKGHRQTIVHSPEEKDCVLCGKKKAKKIKSPYSLMFSITYRMSLENHIKNGSILPIGQLVCGFCKEKHLKGIDTGSSPIVTLQETQGIINKSVIHSEGDKLLNNSHNSVSIRPATSSTSLKRPGSLDLSSSLDVHHLPVKIRPSPPCFSAARNSTEVQVIIQPVQKEVSQAAPGSQTPSSVRSVDNIFSKISRLNEALHSINPKYKPIGFSITSIESCSASILQDAVVATETAVSTLMSVIAPGQESFLWESIKPLLDKKLNGSQAENLMINNNNKPL